MGLCTPTLRCSLASTTPNLPDWGKDVCSCRVPTARVALLCIAYLASCNCNTEGLVPVMGDQHSGDVGAGTGHWYIPSPPNGRWVNAASSQFEQGLSCPVVVISNCICLPSCAVPGGRNLRWGGRRRWRLWEGQGSVKTVCCFCKQQSINWFPLIAITVVGLVRWEQARGCLLVLSSHLGFVWKHTCWMWGNRAVAWLGAFLSRCQNNALLRCSAITVPPAKASWSIQKTIRFLACG